MSQVFILAIALVLVIEGVLPALNPKGYRRAMQMMSEMDERIIRSWGLISLTLGAVLIYLFKN